MNVFVLVFLKKNFLRKLRNIFLMKLFVFLGFENFNKYRFMKIVIVSMYNKLNMNFKLFIEFF